MALVRRPGHVRLPRRGGPGRALHPRKARRDAGPSDENSAFGPHRICRYVVRDGDCLRGDIRPVPRAGRPPAFPKTSRDGRPEEVMKYVSTRGNAEPADFVSASLLGLAPDGGLFVPSEYPQIERPSASATYVETATRILSAFAGNSI